MQLRKFYGRTVAAALAQLKRELGPDALILETHLLSPDDPAVRLHPGARYEVLAAREGKSGTAAPSAVAASTIPDDPNAKIRNPREKAQWAFGTAIRNQAVPSRRADLLEDLGLLRSQLNQLLEADTIRPSADPARVDLGDYHALIDLGVNHDILAPHFRQWLEWRTSPAHHRAWLARLQGGPAAAMRGESLREWLWHVWTDKCGMRNAECGMEEIMNAKNMVGEPAADNNHSAIRNPQSAIPKVLALLGPTGCGKTTTLAKLASINRQEKRQKSVILTLDTFRFGATEQWRRMARLLGIEVEEIVSQADISRSMERWANADWIGIDTPGGLTPDSAPGILYGSILAHCPHLESVIVLPATQQDAVSRDHLKRYRQFGARKVLFTKIDESTRNGGIINLTMDGQWKIDSFATGCRIPEDWEPATRDALWRRVLAPAPLSGGGLAA